MVENKLTAYDMEEALAKFFGWFNHIIIPRVSYGFGLSHETDLLVMSRHGYLTEVEIKVSKSDIKKDLKKTEPRHGGRFVKVVYFAVPIGFENVYEFIDEEYGIIVVDNYESTGPTVIGTARQPRINREAIKLSPDQQFKLARLGTIKMWANRFNGRG